MSDEKDQDPQSEDEAGGLGDELFSSTELPDVDESGPPPGLFDSDDDPGGADPFEDAPTGEIDTSSLGAPQSLPPEETPVMPPEAHAEADAPASPPDAFEDEPTAPAGDLDSDLENSGEEAPAEMPEDSEASQPDAPSEGAGPSATDEAAIKGDPDSGAGQTPVAAGSSALPAHLQLPAIDFSLPDGTEPTSSSGVSASGEGGADLPAHLNLPSFPQFDLPPVPGEEREEDRRVSDGVEVSGIDGAEGSFAEFDDSSAAGPPATSSADSENWAVNDGGAPAPPPPMPPPRPAKKPIQETAPEEMPALPSLPQIKVQEKPKRDPTLIDRQVTEPVKGSGRGLMIFGGIVAVLVAAVAAAFVYRDTLVSTVTEPVDQNDPKYQAEQVRLKATKLWAEANALYEKKELEAAVEKVNASLELDPAFGRSHKLLGVLYVALKKNDFAVKHYERYLALEPNAADAADVQKIIDDYEAAQKKKAPKEKEPEPAPKPKKKKRKRR
ncbi:MAG: hypothetical protein AAFX94_01235 [Myxococcota bacterium]